MDTNNWSWHGVACTGAQAAFWNLSITEGICPWCQKAVSKRYNNINKHLRTCPKKPYSELDYFDPSVGAVVGFPGIDKS